VVWAWLLQAGLSTKDYLGVSLIRQHNRIGRLLRESRLPLEKSLDSFDLVRLPNKLVQQVRSLLDGQFLSRTENILAFGERRMGGFIYRTAARKRWKIPITLAFILKIITFGGYLSLLMRQQDSVTR